MLRLMSIRAMQRPNKNTWLPPATAAINPTTAPRLNQKMPRLSNDRPLGTVGLEPPRSACHDMIGQVRSRTPPLRNEELSGRRRKAVAARKTERKFIRSAVESGKEKVDQRAVKRRPKSERRGRDEKSSVSDVTKPAGIRCCASATHGSENPELIRYYQALLADDVSSL